MPTKQDKLLMERLQITVDFHEILWLFGYEMFN